MKKHLMDEILHVLPVSLREMIRAELEQRGQGSGEISRYGKCCGQRRGQIQEIRLRTGRPIHVLVDGREEAIGGNRLLTTGDMQETMEFVSRFSMYAYEDEIRQGFLTVKGGHRVGIAGKAVLNNGTLKTIRNISFIHIRIACEYRDCAKELLPYLYENGVLQSTLIFSAPGKGKTTIMRDLIRLISDGNRCGEPLSVAVIDERGELAACDQGVPQNDLGARTDVMDGCPKSAGMRLMLRSMAPAVLAADEIGGEEDVEAVFEAAGCGCVMLATAHGESLERLMKKEAFQKLKQAAVFQRYVQLDGGSCPGKCKAVYDAEGRRLCSG
ncbi:MAG: stage III sporulation protein AA [Lachnospiraceae bacterium]|nr:stage III sporulation protein AA [Lachnospiraceae bacterium]